MANNNTTINAPPRANGTNQIVALEHENHAKMQKNHLISCNYIHENDFTFIDDDDDEDNDSSNECRSRLSLISIINCNVKKAEVDAKHNRNSASLIVDLTSDRIMLPVNVKKHRDNNNDSLDNINEHNNNCENYYKNEAVIHFANLDEGHHQKKEIKCSNSISINNNDNNCNNLKIVESDDNENMANNNENDLKRVEKCASVKINKMKRNNSEYDLVNNIDDVNKIDPYAELEIYLEKVKNEISEVFEQLQITETPNFNNEPVVTTCKRDSNNQSIKHSNQQQFEPQLEDWSKKFGDLIENEIKSLNTKNNQTAKQLLTVSDKKKLVNSAKPVIKQISSYHHGNTDKKPPIFIPKKVKHDSGSESLLKINEDYLFNPIVESQKISKESTSNGWTSEESIVLKIHRNVDEDNKSTSSSACEDASTVLSSGKSGNSLNSNYELDNTESGIGTATPPKDIVEHWKHLDTCSWPRGESGPNLPNWQLKTMRSISRGGSDDPDLLEVLSQYDGTESEIEDYHPQIGSSDTLDNIKSIDMSFGTDSSSSDVVLRSKTDIYSISIDGKKFEKRKANSLPVNCLESSKRTLDDRLKGVKNSLETKKKNFYLPLEPFQTNLSNMVDLPSPSSASLHSGHGHLLADELVTKSNSAPILLKKDGKIEFSEQNILRYSRSQSDRYLAEIEAVEACKWLRAAGFPQYAQMYEDLQFPIDLGGVAKDHSFLEHDALQSLYRRLVALNRCATMRLDAQHKQHNNKNDDSDDDGCALSEAWTFQRKDRRWSRVDEIAPKLTLQQANNNNSSKSHGPSRSSTPENLAEQYNETFDYSAFGLTAPSTVDQELMMNNIRLRRTGSDRLKDGAMSFLRRVESINTRRKKKKNRLGIVISEPQAFDLKHLNKRMKDLKCVSLHSTSNPPSPIHTSPEHTYSPSLFAYQIQNDLKKTVNLSFNHLSPSHDTTPKHKSRKSHSGRASPLHFFSQKDTKSDDTSSYCSEGSQGSSGAGSSSSYKKQPKQKKVSRAKRFLARPTHHNEDIGALSDSECYPKATARKKFFKETQSDNKELQVPKISRGGSLNLGKGTNRYREVFTNRSMRSKSAVRNQDYCDSDRDEDNSFLKFSHGSVVRWHSFQNSQKPDSIILNVPVFKDDTSNALGTPISAMSCGQLQVVRKLALVTLTGCMERYCPTHRTGWNWELPKFIKKIKTPDYKDKKVFGVPLFVILQKTGHTLPKSIQTSIEWLKMNALDQIGLFRKSGVKSRIAKLKEIIETSQDDSNLKFDDQQAYDVADMIKQYFRELPESLMTSKLSETFIAIFQHLPTEARADAVQSAVLLLPDEHREVLFSVLEFLCKISDNCEQNQMTANNLAVCLAPSIFHNGINTKTTPSTFKKKNQTGVPNAKDLFDTRASHECLAFMIQNYVSIYTVSNEKMIRCNFGYMEESKPVTLESLGAELQVDNWSGYLYECTKATIKEGRERSRTWISVTSFNPHIDISYKKVGDDHPLRLWKCTTVVDAPPIEILHHILRERKHWDPDILSQRIVKNLDTNSEVYQFSCGGQNVTDYCILRSWNSMLLKGACVIVETSIEHQNAKMPESGIRGVVLASRYLIEPCGSGKSKIMHLSRVDTKGRTPEWHNKNYGHICSIYLSRIRSFFEHSAEGPETEV